MRQSTLAEENSRTPKILIMDDEEAILDVTKLLLKRVGYDADVARDGMEALSVYKSALDEGKRFDAVILDLNVPGGAGGMEVIGSLLEMDPGACAIVSSGDSDDPVVRDPAGYGFLGVLLKPYNSVSLAKAISDALDVLKEKNRV